MEGHVECAGEEALVDSVATEEDLRDVTVSGTTAGIGRGVAIAVVTAEDDTVDEGAYRVPLIHTHLTRGPDSSPRPATAGRGSP